MPFHPRRILVATDYSEHSRAAADAAGAMARAFGARLSLLHVVPLSVYVAVASHQEGRSFATADLRASVKEGAQRDGDQELARLREDGTEAELVLVDGPPPAEIARVAQEGGYDLVVIGTHGRTGRLHLPLGSVAESVVRTCGVSVLVVRNGQAATPAPA